MATLPAHGKRAQCRCDGFGCELPEGVATRHVRQRFVVKTGAMFRVNQLAILFLLGWVCAVTGNSKVASTSILPVIVYLPQSRLLMVRAYGPGTRSFSLKRVQISDLVLLALQPHSRESSCLSKKA